MIEDKEDEERESEKDAERLNGQRRAKREKKKERERGKKFTAIYSNLTLDSVALNNRPRLRRNWSPFNNGLLSNELVLSARNGPGWLAILPPVSRCCDSKELEINLSYNHFFCGPRPTTGINQISSFRTLSRALSVLSRPFLSLSARLFLSLSFSFSLSLSLFLSLGLSAHCTCIYIQERTNSSLSLSLSLSSSSHVRARATDRLSYSFANHDPYAGLDR